MTAAAKTEPDQALVLRDDADAVATLTLNRPDKFNALSSAMLTALKSALEDVARDTAVRAVILRGAGRVFCAGHDLKEMRAETDPGFIRRLFNQCSDVMLTLTRMPQPVIAQVHGIATAAGCQLVAQCDLAVAADDARFATSGINVGLFCSTPMVAVTRNLPRKQAMELLMTGDFISAETAKAYGLINHAVPAEQLDTASRDLALKIADKSPTGIAIGKQLFYTQLEQGLEAAYTAAAEHMACNMEADDAKGGIDAFNAKQPMPRWRDR